MSKIDKKGFYQNNKYRFKIWFIHSFHDKIQFKGLFNINFIGSIQFKKLFNNLFFPENSIQNLIQKIMFGFNIQFNKNIHSIRKPGYRTPLIGVLNMVEWVSLKRSNKVLFSHIDLVSKGPPSQKVWPNQIFVGHPHCNYIVKLDAADQKNGQQRERSMSENQNSSEICE